uniref:Leucine rich repeat containing 31 n=1 Tax=Sphaeramia orbicularis TaxID=375764 RepID=A0A673CN56_9TELE
MELASLLQFLPHLEEVDLSWNELIGGSLRVLTSHLNLVGGIRSLALSGCRLSSEDVMALGEALSFVPLLEILDLSWNAAISGDGLQCLLGKLSPAVRELHLVACHLTAADAVALGMLAQEVASGGFEELAVALGHASALSTLRLQGCGLSTDRGSLRHLPSLRQVDLSCNKGLSGGLDHLSPHLAHLTHLESLDLHLCSLTHGDLEALVQVLPSLTALTELDVSSNKDAGGVVHSLVSALPLTQMRRLPFNSCSLNQESFTALGTEVLLSVDVSWCKVVGGRLPLLLDALQPSIILELRLSSCELTTDDLSAVCSRGGLSSLRVLDLSYNGSVGADGWTALFTAGGLGSTEDVDLSLRPLTSASSSAWLPALLRALPQLPALNRLAMRRWTVGSADRQQLDRSLKKRNVLLEPGLLLCPPESGTPSQTTSQLLSHWTPSKRG